MLTVNYTYNARNLLASVGQMSYTYDHNGRRVSETFTDLMTPANSWTRELLWDVAMYGAFSTYGDVLAETDGSSGALHVRYVLADGQLLSQQQGGNFYYYLTDAQGSVRILADSDTGATGLTDEDTYDYDAYGDIHAQMGTTPNRYLYTGQRHDAATGDYYLRARQYDPGNGRFLSRDTWPLDHANPVELNRYMYAAGNPVMFSDPSGWFAGYAGGHKPSNSFLQFAGTYIRQNPSSVLAAGVKGGLYALTGYSAAAFVYTALASYLPDHVAPDPLLLVDIVTNGVRTGIIGVSLGITYQLLGKWVDQMLPPISRQDLQFRASTFHEQYRQLKRRGYNYTQIKRGEHFVERNRIIGAGLFLTFGSAGIINEFSTYVEGVVNTSIRGGTVDLYEVMENISQNLDHHVLMITAFIGAGITADYLNLTFGDDAQRAIMIEGMVSFLDNLNLP